MTEWLKLYIGSLVTDISAHKAMIDAQAAEIARLKAELEKANQTAVAESAND